MNTLLCCLWVKKRRTGNTLYR